MASTRFLFFLSLFFLLHPLVLSENTSFDFLSSFRNLTLFGDSFLRNGFIGLTPESVVVVVAAAANVSVVAAANVAVVAAVVVVVDVVAVVADVEGVELEKGGAEGEVEKGGEGGEVEVDI